MLLCRSLLRQVHVPRLAPFASRKIAFTYELLQVTPNLVGVPACTVQTPVDPPELPDIAPATAPLSDRGPVVDVPKLLEILHKKPNMSSTSQPGSTGSTEKSAEVSTADRVPLLAYRLLREHDRKSIARLSVHSYVRLVEHAFRTRSHSTLHDIVIDILETFHGDKVKLMELVEAYLALSVRFDSLSDRRTLFLLSQLQASGLIQSLSPTIIVRLTHAASRDLSNKPLLVLLTPLIAKCLRGIPHSSRTKSVALSPPVAFRVGCVFACKLLEAELKQQALDVFSALLDTKCVPLEAIPVLDDTSPQDPAFLIRSVIIRSCIFWDLRLQLQRLLQDMIKCIPQPDNPLLELTIDGMSALLESPCTPSNIAFCAGLIPQIHAWTSIAIPHPFFHFFYESAMRMDCGKDAESVFAHTRMPRIFAKFQCPIPKGEALTPFLRYLTLCSRNVHLARVLVTEVVKNREPIPLRDRAEFIALTASNGYASQARTLWERYARDRDGKVVVGNAAMLVRMASLFANLIKNAHAKLQEAMELRSASPRGKDLGGAVQRQKLEDLNRFAQQLITEFILALPSLRHASHWELTSLARTYLLFGNVTDGFSTLKILLDRKEVPDLHDVNVALSVLAQHDPEGATWIIQRMVNRGLRPDAVTFGTVLHQAILRGDEDQINALMEQASKLGARLTQKTISSLIQNYLTVKVDTPPSTQTGVQRAMQIVESMMAQTPGFVCTPNTGEACIRASLRADDPMMAFRFWKLLVKGKTEWVDGKQRLLRGMIASGIRRHCEDGRICQGDGAMALSRLGKKTSSRDSSSGSEWTGRGRGGKDVP